MPTLEELLKSKDKSVLDKIQEIVESSTAKRISEGAPLSGQQIEAINQYPELVEKLNFSKSAPTASEALPEFPSAKQAIQSERGDQIIRNIMRSTETPDISSKLAATDEASKIISPVSSTVDDAANILSKAESVGLPASKYEQLLSKIYGMGESALSNPTLARLAPLAKGVGIIGGTMEAIGEGKEAKKSFKAGHPLDAAVHGIDSAANAVGAASLTPLISGIVPAAATSIAAPIAIGRAGGKLLNAIYPEYKPSQDGGGDPLIGTDLIPPGQQPQSSPIPKKEELDMSSGDQTFSESEGSKIEAPAPVEMPSAAQQALLEQGFTNSTVENLMEAQKAANQNRLIANIMQGTGQIGAGIAGLGAKSQVKAADFKNLLESADVPVEQFKQQVEMEKKDPNSQYSVGFRNFAKPIIKQLGIDESLVEKMSGEQLGSLIPQLRSMYNEKIEGEYRKEALQVARESKKEEKRKQEDAKFNDFITKRGDTLKKSDAYKAFVSTTDLDNVLTSALQNPNSAKDMAVLYNFIKALDRDSAVREGELALAQKAKGMWGGLETELRNLTLNPRMLNKKLIKDIQEYTQLTKLAAKNRMAEEFKSLEAQVKKRGKTPEEELVDTIPGYKDYLDSSKAPKKILVKKGYNPKTNKTQLIYSDETKEIVDGRQ